MDGISTRKASFRSVIALLLEGKVYTFYGRVDGTVSNEIRGTLGFGYDPIFIPKDSEKTFAEIPIEQKNSISHRIRALQKMCNFLMEKHIE
jgi:XTP/dITP diphosphohydrolase